MASKRITKELQVRVRAVRRGAGRQEAHDASLDVGLERSLGERFGAKRTRGLTQKRLVQRLHCVSVGRATR